MLVSGPGLGGSSGVADERGGGSAAGPVSRRRQSILPLPDSVRMARLTGQSGGAARYASIRRDIKPDYRKSMPPGSQGRALVSFHREAGKVSLAPVVLKAGSSDTRSVALRSRSNRSKAAS